MLMIRFQRIGRTNDPAFRIAVLEKERAAQAGNIVEQVGTYNPKTKAVTLDEAAVKDWIAKGAQVTDSVRNLLITKGVLEGKKVNVLPKKSPIVKESEEASADPETATAEDKGTAPAEAVSGQEELPSEAEVTAEAEPAAAEDSATEEQATEETAA